MQQNNVTETDGSLEDEAECDFLRTKTARLSSLGKGQDAAYWGLKKKTNFIPFSL